MPIPSTKGRVTAVRLTLRELIALKEYSASFPTYHPNWEKPDGRFPVRMWKRSKSHQASGYTNDPADFIVGWYESSETDPETHVQARFAEVEMIDAPEVGVLGKPLRSPFLSWLKDRGCLVGVGG